MDYKVPKIIHQIWFYGDEMPNQFTKNLLILKNYNTDFDYLLCDIEHSLYNDLREHSPDFYKTYYGRYFDWLEWNYIIDKFNFTLLLFKK